MLKIITYILFFSFLSSASISQECIEYPGLPVVGENHQIYQDKEGLIWLTTENGLFCYDGKSIEQVFFETDSIADPVSNWYLSATQDGNGNFWFGHRGKALTFYNKKEDTFKRFTSKDGYPGNRAWQILEHNSILWIADESGLIKFDPDKKESTHLSFLHLFKKAPIPKASVVRKILLQEKEEKFWLATYAGLMEFDITTETFTRIKMSNQIKNDARGVDWLLIDLYQKDQHIYCTSWGGGLLKYNIESKDWSQYYSPNKPTNFVPLQIEPLNENELLCTGYLTSPLIFNINNSIFKKAEHPFSELEGSVRYSDASLLDDSGYLWISNDLNICRIKVKEGKQISTNPFIKKIHIDNKLIKKSGRYYGDPIIFQRAPSSIRFEFNNVQQGKALDYTYQYKLEGFDKEWIDSDRNTNTTYTSLPGGNYSFKVRSRLGQKEWVDARPVQFDIKKKFYQEWWFTGSIVAGLLSLVAGFYFFNLKRIKEKEALKTAYNKELLEMEMMALRAQMNPHFMFNSLNSINQFIMTNEPRAASKYLSKFAMLMRSILNNSKEKEVTLEDELKMIELYMEMEGLRFKERFQYEIVLEHSLNTKDILIQPMLIQPYIENAIWHGLMPLEKNGKITIALSKKKDRLLCKIEDNGIGRAASTEHQKKSLVKKKSMGMQITSKRMALAEEVNQIKSTLEIIDKKDVQGKATGTTVLLSLPYKTKS